MKVNVNSDACIGCGACTYTCPEVFELQDEGYAKAIVNEISDELKDKVEEAKEGCPTSAIITE